MDNRNIEDECATQENIVKPESTEQDTRENGLNNIESIENTSKKQKSNKHPLSNELVATNVTESPSQKKKKRKSGIDSNEISTEENLNTKSQEFTKNKIDEAHDKLSNKTSKRKSEKISTSVDREESKKDLEQNDVPRDRMKKQTLEVPAAIEKDCPIKPVSNVEIDGGKFKKMRTDENTNAISNKTKIDNNNSEIKKVESKSDETSKKGKKRFRQRARYKNKPKNEENKDEGNKPEEEDKEDESSEEEHDKENTNDLGGFQVIGNLEFQKKKKVKYG